jgi:hypothetical protein
MNQTPEVNLNETPELTLVSGCLVVISSVLIGMLLLMMGYPPIKPMNLEGLAILGVLAAVISVALTPVIARLQPHQNLTVGFVLLFLADLLCVTPDFRALSTEGFPVGNWILFGLFSGVTVFLASRILLPFRDHLGTTGPARCTVLVSILVMAVSMGNGIISGFITLAYQGNFVEVVFLSLMFAANLMVLSGVIILGIFGCIRIVQYLVAKHHSNPV